MEGVRTTGRLAAVEGSTAYTERTAVGGGRIGAADECVRTDVFREKSDMVRLVTDWHVCQSETGKEKHGGTYRLSSIRGASSYRSLRYVRLPPKVRHWRSRRRLHISRIVPLRLQKRGIWSFVHYPCRLFRIVVSAAGRGPRIAERIAKAEQATAESFAET